MANPFEKQPLVFVVDDEEQIAKMFAVVLQMNLFNAVPYVNPLRALGDAEDRPPDYLLTDVLMPEMNGVELAMAIKDMAPDCKILIFSGQDSSEDLIKQANQRGYGFTLLLKPIHPKKMVDLIKTCEASHFAQKRRFCNECAEQTLHLNRPL